MEIVAYLTFNGQCETAMKFYEKVLRGKIEAMFPHEGTPAAEFVPAEQLKLIMHARLRVGDALLMASDAPPDRYAKPAGIAVSLHVKDAAEADRIFQELSAGGEVQMPIQETFWAKRFAMFSDKFSIPWMVNCEA